MRDRRSIFRDFLIRRKRRWTWVVVGFKTALHIFWNAAGKTVGSNRRRQPGVCMNHRSYHLHMPAHLHVVYK
jgi:hypothetical protein